MRISTSFSEEEVHLMDDLFKILLRGGDARILMRSKALPGLMKKIIAARERLGQPMPVEPPPDERAVPLPPAPGEDVPELT